MLVKSKKRQCDDRRAYLFHDLCDSHTTYLCPPQHSRADQPAAENCRCFRVPGRPCLSQLDRHRRNLPDQSQCSPMPPLQRSNRGERARTRRGVAVPDTIRSLRPRNDTLYGHDWAKRRLMGFLFCRGPKLQPQFQVFREPTNGRRSRLNRTATHTTAWRVAHRCGRACIAPVESIVIFDCSACLIFFSL